MKKKVLIAVIAVVLFGIGGIAHAVEDGCGVLFTAYYQIRLHQYIDNPTSGMKMLLGDSIVEGFPEEQLGPEYVNRGIAGNTICGVAGQVATHVISEQPVEVVVAVGINDVMRHTDATSFYVSYYNVLSALRKNLPDAQIYARSILPTGLTYWTWNSWVAYYNLIIQWVAARVGVPYLNTNPHFLCGSILCTPYTTDGIHLSPAGYEVYIENFYTP